MFIQRWTCCSCFRVGLNPRHSSNEWASQPGSQSRFRVHLFVQNPRQTAFMGSRQEEIPALWPAFLLISCPHLNWLGQWMADFNAVGLYQRTGLSPLSSSKYLFLNWHDSVCLDRTKDYVACTPILCKDPALIWEHQWRHMRYLSTSCNKRFDSRMSTRLFWRH